jgi:predicted AlkP superfamily pyrophosphatase or phosphodiesterase
MSDTIGCESLFDVVRAAGGRSAGVGQPNYTGGEFLARHADLCGRTDANTDDSVVEMVIALSKAHLPRFIIAQLGEPDTVFHRFGPYSSKVQPVIAATDRRLQRLVSELSSLSYAVMILADHGQHSVDEPGEDGVRGGHDGSRWDEDSLVPCTWTS